jgi:glyoxylase-like metal-dependent hydrolase (beta-lactamase superfamily II)
MFSGNQRRVSVRKLGIVLVLVICGSVSTDYTDLSGHTKTHNPNADDCGRCVLDEALQAFGGEEQLQQLASITMKGVGEQHASAESQGYASAQQSTEAYTETLVAFPSHEKLAFEHRTDKGDQKVRWRRWLYDGENRNVGDFLAQGKFTRRNPSVVNERIKISRRIPHMLLLEANRSSSTQDFGALPAQYDGRPHNIISFTPPGEKTDLRLFFDAKTNLLSKFEYRIDFPTLGDTLIEYTYAGYRQDPLLGWVPTRHTIKVAGNEAMEVNVAMTANTPEADEIFKLPEFPGHTAEETFQLPERLRNLIGKNDEIVEAAPGVNVMEVGGFTLMFVEFKDFILMAEAPASHPSITSIPADNQRGSSALAEEAIRRIKEKIPKKPIRYLAVSHYHSDHSGGARAFVAEGASILTTPGNKRFFERMATGANTLVPDRLSRIPRVPTVEPISKRRVITDGVRTVELINVGPNPHTQESLVVYIPREKILFQGDLFYFDLGAPFPPKNRTNIMSFFAKWLKDIKLAPERIYSVHSHGFATMDHVNKLLATKKH